MLLATLPHLYKTLHNCPSPHHPMHALILMASQTTPATAFPHYTWPDPSGVTCSSFSQASNLCRNRANSSSTTSTFMSYFCHGHAKAGSPKRRKPRTVWLGKPQEAVHGLKYYLSRLGLRGVISPASYLAKKAKAFYSRIGNSNGSPDIQKEVMCVEPYFSMPVVPVTSTGHFI
ncbi:hypothetical protein ACLOJK_034119 [Asimina triloba]